MIDDLKHIGLKRLLEIRENQYRSKNNDQDYCPIETESRIYEIKTKMAENFVKSEALKDKLEKESLVLVSANIKRYHRDFLKRNEINLSKIIRDTIEEMILKETGEL